MTAAAAAAARPTAIDPAPASPPPFPTAAALALEQTPMAELERVLVRGAAPDLDALVGWEFRGINHLPLNALPVAQIFGIKKFVKGFVRAPDGTGRVTGYNVAVARNVLDGRWRLLPSDREPKRFRCYQVAPVDPTARDNRYLHAVLLDYSKGGNQRGDVANGLRDYLVQVYPHDPDLFLGKAYYAVGPARIATSFFVLERHRRVRYP